MALAESAVYCTLLLSDHYLPGAVVLAHSLRDNGSKAKLVALYTPDSLQPATVQELEIVYDEIIPVNPLTNLTPANLWLMDRPDLIATFTKIELWRQTQFKRIVYLDCDIVAVRAPNELLELDVDFAAAPDVGWPDCFNSGVMVLRPNLLDYFALRALAERGISFDGADQGLLNMHFRDWHRLSFTYNCTPSANYQYIPAYNHFQSTISMIHFIGAQKPWTMGRQVQPVDSPYNKLLGRWWAVYDSHYRPVVSPQQAAPTESTGPIPHYAPYGTFESSDTHVPQQKPIELGGGGTPHGSTSSGPEQHTAGQHGELHYDEPHHNLGRHDKVHQDTPYSGGSYHEPGYQGAHGTAEEGAHHWDRHHGGHHGAGHHGAGHHGAGHHGGSHHEVEHQERYVHVPPPFRSAVPQYVRGEEHVAAYIHPHSHQTTFAVQTEPTFQRQEGSVPEASPRPWQDQAHHYQQPAEPLPESQHGPPSPKPKAQTFEPPKAEWDASREPPPLNTKPEGFALETKTYTMSEDQQLFQPPPSYPEAPKNMYYEVPTKKPEPEKLAQLFPWENDAPKPTRVFPEDDQTSISTIPRSLLESTEGGPGQSSQSRDTTWTWTSEEPAESWEHYTRSNAWDEVPEIQRYISSLQQTRKGRVQVLTGGSSSTEARDVRITDFPSEQERPSLPVTPAPIRRRPGELSPSDNDLLPSAEGVPSQEDWNPSAGLEELRIRRSEVLDHPDLLFERILSSRSTTSDQVPPSERTND
ncbi:nucleotide-diphospho-sugar transferase [Aspergillus indologenus CBS 114.80]|uniref:glycogenin glucosyltransferase n=1 Tax=Aspergillus indologenus CBS 114.80 TaxID=1450541 RepID=A0A2V5HW74_9EURO|nr:nucleotide-diphospho-sugar transferase [Aspergillus indologenus CBS 114.80]